MVSDWLSKCMFATHPDPTASAQKVADALSDYASFKSHSRRVSTPAQKALGVKVVDLDSDQQLQDLVLAIHHAVNHVMNHTGVVKLVENHNGKAFVRRVGTIVPVPGPVAVAPAN